MPEVGYRIPDSSNSWILDHGSWIMDHGQKANPDAGGRMPGFTQIMDHGSRLEPPGLGPGIWIWDLGSGIWDLGSSLRPSAC